MLDIKPRIVEKIDLSRISDGDSSASPMTLSPVSEKEGLMSSGEKSSGLIIFGVIVEKECFSIRKASTCLLLKSSNKGLEEHKLNKKYNATLKISKASDQEDLKKKIQQKNLGSPSPRLRSKKMEKKKKEAFLEEESATNLLGTGGTRVAGIRSDISMYASSDALAESKQVKDIEKVSGPLLWTGTWFPLLKKVIFNILQGKTETAKESKADLRRSRSKKRDEDVVLEIYEIKDIPPSISSVSLCRNFISVVSESGEVYIGSHKNSKLPPLLFGRDSEKRGSSFVGAKEVFLKPFHLLNNKIEEVNPLPEAKEVLVFESMRLASGKNIKTVSVSPYHGIAVTTDNDVIGWGYNNKWANSTDLSQEEIESKLICGQLGLSEEKSLPKQIPQNLGAVISVSTGFCHSAILTDQGLFTAGMNDNGQFQRILSCFYFTLFSIFRIKR